MAARGLDIPELNFIIHYQLPLKPEEFTHRNGRTARMNAQGTAYVLKWTGEQLPDFISSKNILKLQDKQTTIFPKWVTLYISGGRRDKISKGDIAGLFFKQGGLKSDELRCDRIKARLCLCCNTKRKGSECY